MDECFSMITGSGQMPALAAKELQDASFVVIPGPVSAERLPQFAAAYDKAMDSRSGADLKIARTTTRMYDFVNQSAECVCASPRGPSFASPSAKPPIARSAATIAGISAE